MKITSFVLSALASFALGQISAAQDSSAAAPGKSDIVSRRSLLQIDLDPAKQVAHLDVREVTLVAHAATELHLHPIPIVGQITDGHIAFQVEGQPLKHLSPGDAFLEPADARIVHFDNEDDHPTRFFIVALVGSNDHEYIRMLKE